MNAVTAVKQFKLAHSKSELKKNYTFQNDAEINYLSKQLCTISINFSLHNG